MSKAVDFEERLARHLDELKWLYCELYPEDGFSYLCGRLKARYEERRASLMLFGSPIRTGTSATIWWA